MLMAMAMFFTFARHWVLRADSRARANTGNSMAARIPMIAITTNSSMSVNPRRLAVVTPASLEDTHTSCDLRWQTTVFSPPFLRRPRRHPRSAGQRHHGLHRAVGLRQVDDPALLRPDERSRAGGPGPRPGHPRRRGHLRRRRPPDRGPQARRHGLPAAQPVPDVDLRERRLWAPPPRRAR